VDGDFERQELAMFPAAFEYHRPKSLSQAVTLLGQLGDAAKVLAGGHSLIPAMKLRLARPAVIIDIGRIDELNYIRDAGDGVAIGAMTSHRAVETSAMLRDRCPLMCEVARHIGDVQVRNRGTVAGSVVHADPAADWPAGLLALGAEFDLCSRTGMRRIAAVDFFKGLMETAIRPDEILCEIRVPGTGRGVAYVKTEQKASGFALCGVAAVIDSTRTRVAVGVTGVATVPYRAAAVERALVGKALSTTSFADASSHAKDNVEALSDIHATAEFRAHLARVNTERALAAAMERV
jgi:carbon-monoxide dehydrogenase medium subunit